MPKYLVTWEIDSDAANPVLAAREAFAHMQREDSIASVFEVIECDTGTSTKIDLEEPHCPTCGNRHLMVEVRQWADIQFSAADINVTDGPRGDLDWSGGSTVICSERLGGCGRTGQMVEFSGGR